MFVQSEAPFADSILQWYSFAKKWIAKMSFCSVVWTSQVYWGLAFHCAIPWKFNLKDSYMLQCERKIFWLM